MQMTKDFQYILDSLDYQYFKLRKIVRSFSNENLFRVEIISSGYMNSYLWSDTLKVLTGMPVTALSYLLHPTWFTLFISDATHSTFLII